MHVERPYVSRLSEHGALDEAADRFVLPRPLWAHPLYVAGGTPQVLGPGGSTAGLWCERQEDFVLPAARRRG